MGIALKTPTRTGDVGTPISIIMLTTLPNPVADLPRVRETSSR